MFFCPGDRCSSDLREWIEFVKVKGVGELVLDFSGNERHSDSTDDDDIRWGMNTFRMPNSLFTCLSISSLDLTWCILEPPHDFKSFKALRSVALYGVTINGAQLGEIIRRFPILEDLTTSYCDSLKLVKIDHLQLKILTLESCFDVEEMEIRTPNLKNLQYNGQVCDNPIFNDVSSINEATLLLTHDELDYELHLWQNFLTKLSHVSSLEVKSHKYSSGSCGRRSFTYLVLIKLRCLRFSISRYNDITECHVTKMTYGALVMQMFYILRQLEPS
ncbi:F-box/FBD/LRR-repeat protein At1g13570-like [Aristolochia californica]|uniref:F-box/FBD/LRR-repeat protein At1g13570-like n=1 Tax=Aristolochia californica TaxID=171875 RepID=UPI0035E1BB28